LWVHIPSAQPNRATPANAGMSRYNGAMPKSFAGYVAFEDEATELKIYDIQLVNGLFQTPDYASAMIRAHFPERASDCD